MIFGEDQAVFVVTSKHDATSLIEKINEFGAVAEHIGMTGSDQLTFDLGNGPQSTSLADLRAAHEGFFPKLMGADAALA